MSKSNRTKFHPGIDALEDRQLLSMFHLQDPIPPGIAPNGLQKLLGNNAPQPPVQVAGTIPSRHGLST